MSNNKNYAKFLGLKISRFTGKCGEILNKTKMFINNLVSLDNNFFLRKNVR
jgi:hypothetical protein